MYCTPYILCTAPGVSGYTDETVEFTYIEADSCTCMQHANQGSTLMDGVNHLIIDQLSELC